MAAIGGSVTRAARARPGAQKGWSKAKRATFLDVLAATANVRSAAAAVRLSAAGAYAVRRRDAGFAQAWNEALGIAVERLQDELLARAMGRGHDVGGLDADAGAGDAADAAFDEALAIKLVQLHQARSGGRAQRDELIRQAPADEVDAAIRRKLDAILRRIEPQ